MPLRSPLQASIQQASIASAAMRMLSGETNGLAVAFRQHSAAVKDTGTPANDYDGTPDGLLTYSGSSAKWVWNPAGVLTENPAGSLPYDFDPVTGAAKGLLVEGQRTNLILQSQTFDHSSWTKAGVTITANAASAPDGATTADKIVESTATSGRSAYQSFSITGNHACSVYAKSAGDSRWLRFQAGSSDSYFNPDTGAWGTVGAGTSEHAVEDVGDGWYRASLLYDGTAATDFFALGLAEADGTSSYAGDGSSGIYVWQAQLEAGAATSSPIPTTIATVTRAADNVSIATTAFPFSATAGTYSIIFRDAAAGSGILTLSDGTINERLMLYESAGAKFRSQDGGVNQADIVTNAAVVSGVHKIAAAWAANDFAVSVDGGTVAIDTTGTLPTVTSLRFGNNGAAASYLNGHIEAVKYVPSRVSDANLLTW